MHMVHASYHRRYGCAGWVGGYGFTGPAHLEVERNLLAAPQPQLHQPAEGREGRHVAWRIVATWPGWRAG